MSVPEMVAFVVANSGHTFEQVGEMNLPQFRAIQRAIAKKIQMTVNPFAMFGMAGRGSAPKGPARGSSQRVELTPDQFEQVVRDRKRSLGKETLSLEEVLQG